MQFKIYLNGDIQRAITNAESYIWTNASENGWSDFRTLIGESTEWVTGYVLSSLRDNPQRYPLIKKIAKNLLKTQRRNGGWGYNPKAPADADSTSAILSAFSINRFMPRISLKKASDFLSRLQDKKSGGFRTYGLSLHLYLLIGSFRISFKGWRSAHTDITAAAVIALTHYGMSVQSDRMQKADQFLKNTKSVNGLWSSYWWKGVYYGTAMSIRALSSFEDLSKYNETAQSILFGQQKDGSWNHLSNEWGSAFSTALAISSLLYFSSFGYAIQRGMKWLVEHQNYDGSWDSMPIMRIPYPWDTKPSEDMEKWRQDDLGTGVILRDQHRLFTTATVLRTLYEYQSLK